jgi:Tol biopolymer transport system component
MAFIKPTDVILDDKQNLVYMIGSSYSAIASSLSSQEDNNTIYRFDLKNNSKSTFYLDKGPIDRLSLSPNNEKLSVLRGYTGFFEQESELVIIDIKEKKEILAFKDAIEKYKWQPDGKRIAYITGGNIEARGFSSTGVWIYDLQTEEKKKIANEALDVEWLSNDKIRIINYMHVGLPSKDEIEYHNFTYNFSDGSVKDRDVKGAKFSLDGKYAILLAPEYGNIAAEEDAIRIALYNLHAGEIIPRTRLTNIFSNPSRIKWDTFFWVKGNRIVFQKSMATTEGTEKKPQLRQRSKAKKSSPSSFEVLVCDIEKNKVLKTITGYLVGSNNNRSKLVIFSDGKFEIVDVP